MLEIQIKVSKAIESVLENLVWSKDNLLAFAVSLQPNFIVWSAALALNEKVEESARMMVVANAQEELYGLDSEGSHAPLCHDFFQQIGLFETKHYRKAANEISAIYKTLGNPAVLLTFLTCLELLSSHIMPFITNKMREYGATDFSYVEAHKIADNSEDGHGIKFLESLVLQKPSVFELDLGIKLFHDLFKKIFS